MLPQHKAFKQLSSAPAIVFFFFLDFSILCFDVLSFADSKGTAVPQASQLPEPAKGMFTNMLCIYKPTNPKSSIVSTASYVEFSYLDPTPFPLSHGPVLGTDILRAQWNYSNYLRLSLFTLPSCHTQNKNKKQKQKLLLTSPPLYLWTDPSVFPCGCNVTACSLYWNLWL